MNSSESRRNRDYIARYIADGSTRAGCGMMGLELEHIVVHRVTHAAVGYSDEHGVAEVLSRLSASFPRKHHEGDHLIGLECDTYSVSIEPAGQIEISVAPCASLTCIRVAYESFRRLIDPILDEFDIELLTCGYHPTACARDLELIPKERYRLMDEHFKHTGHKGVCMMRASASTQVSIDYTDGADAILKFKVANLLGPLISFICDNAPVFETDLHAGRMARTRIWSDTDAERCMTVEHLFDEGFDTPYTFDSYAEHIMTSMPILVMEGREAHGTDPQTADEVYAGHVLRQGEIEHLLGMFFPDVRFKRYIEIRMADSLPIAYALSYAALIEGIFYDDENLDELASRFSSAQIGPDSIAEAKANLMQDAWLADVYGRPAWEWLDDIAALAWRGVPERDREALRPLIALIERRDTLYDRSVRILEGTDGPAATMSETGLERRYRDIVDGLGGDLEGHRIAQGISDSSTAYYHGSIVDYGYVPYLMPPSLEESFARIASTMHGILAKMIEHYLVDEGYRRLFGFSERLERAIVADSGYDELLPICRMDIFLDDDAQPYPDGDLRFAFCEVNTDGTSAMNEDRETGRALMATPAFKSMREGYALSPQSLFDGIVREVLADYAQWRALHPSHPDKPTVGIVDFTESATSYEFLRFAERFLAHDVRAVICDARKLDYRDGVLRDGDGIPLDCIYRRAVTAEIMEHGSEVSALLSALEEGACCCVGALRTQIPHCKRSFSIMHSPATMAFLSSDEVEFVRRHVPYTALLDGRHVDLDAIRSNRDAWIIKPDDGYATRGVTAGCTVTDDEWNALVDSCSAGGYVVQSYCEQHPVPNVRANLEDPERATGAELAWVDRNRLIGLYVYGGNYAGVYVRAGSNAVLGGPWDSDTLPAFHVDACRRPVG